LQRHVLDCSQKKWTQICEEKSCKNIWTYSHVSRPKFAKYCSDNTEIY
jgi:hypothetical protein